MEFAIVETMWPQSNEGVVSEVSEQAILEDALDVAMTEDQSVLKGKLRAKEKIKGLVKKLLE